MFQSLSESEGQLVRRVVMAGERGGKLTAMKGRKEGMEKAMVGIKS